MKRTPLILAALAAVSISVAQVSYTGGNLTENFDSLVNTGTANVWTDNVTLPGWYMRRVQWNTTSGTMVVLANQFNAGDGSSNAGAVYSFGSANSTERALGSIGSGSQDQAEYGLRLTNGTNSTLTSFTLTYTGEQWRNGGNTSPQSLQFSYNIGGTTIGNDQQTATGAAGYQADPNFTRFSSLDFTSPVTGSTAAALDGNAASNRTLVTATVTGVNWAPGQDLWIRWVDLNDPGNDHGLAVDDLSFSAAPVPEPASIAAIAIGITALLRKRRKTA